MRRRAAFEDRLSSATGLRDAEAVRPEDLNDVRPLEVLEELTGERFLTRSGEHDGRLFDA